MNELNKGEIVIYTAKDGSISLNTRLEDDTIWLTQKAMAELFGCSSDNISLHLKNIYNEKELDKNSTTEDFSVVQKEGTRTVSRKQTFYNLDAIISVGYRVNSSRATQFRIWATSVLKDYITKGYALNEKRLKEQQTQISTLKNSIALMERSLLNQIENLDIAREVSKILNKFALGLNQ